MRRVLSAALPALIALTPVNCGGAGGPGRLTLKEFNSQAAAICARVTAATEDQTTADLEALGTAVNDLGKLDPPVGVEKEFKVLLRTGRAWLEAIRGQARDAGSLGDKFADDARAVGLHGCAEAVP